MTRNKKSRGKVGDEVGDEVGEKAGEKVQYANNIQNIHDKKKYKKVLHFHSLMIMNELMYIYDILMFRCCVLTNTNSNTEVLYGNRICDKRRWIRDVV